MAGVLVIVHDGPHGLGIAVDYYKQFPLEPSPAGALDLTNATFVKVKGITFDRLLVEMAKAPGGGTVLVVCHAHDESGSVLQSSGLFMPLAAGSGLSAQDEAFQRLLEVLAAVRKADEIRAMPTTNAKEEEAKKDSWIGLVTGLSLGFPPDGSTLAQLEQFFEHGLTTIAQELKMTGGGAGLKQMIAHIENVQSLQLDRVEFRACKIGKDSETLAHLKQLFGCRKLLAPIARTFYINRMPVTTLSAFDRQFIATRPATNSRQPGPAGNKIKDPGDFVIDAMKTNPSLRTFWDVEFGFIPPADRRLSLGTTTIKLKGHVLAMIVEEVGPSWYRAFAGTWHETSTHTPDATNESAFVHQYIMTQSQFGSGDIMISGFWTPGEELPWLLPNDSDYIDHVKQV
jgi:hypothetical protein